MEFWEKLHYLKQRDQLTTLDISKRSGIPVGTLNKLLNGETKNPTLQVAERLACVFKVPIQYFANKDLPLEQEIGAASDGMDLLHISRREAQMIERFRSLSAREQERLEAILCNMEKTCSRKIAQNAMELLCYMPKAWGPRGFAENNLDIRPVTVIADAVAEESDFAALLFGKGLEPLYARGSLLGVKQTPAKNGEVGIFLVNGEGYIRKLHETKHQRKLVTINREVPNLVLQASDDLLCLGTVIGLLTPAAK